MVLQYKCPDCGADMEYDSKTGMLQCPSCGHLDNIENYKDPNYNPKEDIPDYEEHKDNTSYSTYEDDNARQYQCQNCGATLITTKDTSATTCNFCGSPMILGDRLSGKLAPSHVIPFQISRQEAEEGFRKWCKKGLLTPKGFMSADRIKSITGIYVPFWLYDLNGRGDAHAICTRTRHYSQGDYNITETKYYDVYRRVNVFYNKVPCDASEKMDDKLMDKLEPFSYQDLKEFNTPYLAGYIAEKYNYTDKELFPRVEERAETFVSDYIRDTIIGYDSIRFQHKDIQILQQNADYSLLPVWMICYDYQQGEHSFAMNGQTGKVVGKPPLSKGKIAAWFGGLSAASLIIMQIITFIVGGGF
ncbi:primosomal protein N' (replication factor Y) - superfamily II helicase [Lachnospiraceae bacterium KM106-2]|nr:primosomal protein N' (replication factor Y) - superfamily II helicase [Lachnospiraceae bacterium KM106-2]